MITKEGSDRIQRRDWNDIARNAIKRWKREKEPGHIPAMSIGYCDGLGEIKMISTYPVDDFVQELADKLRDIATSWYEQGENDVRCNFHSGLGRLLRGANFIEMVGEDDE